MSDQLLIAETIARIAHEGQTDKNGQPYIDHPRAVAAAVGDESKPAAWLHDVLEDCPWVTEATLYAAGVEPATVATVLVLTRDVGESYQDVIERIATSGDRRAITIKLADLAHNRRPSEPNPNREARYVAAERRLLEALNTEVLR